MKTSKEFFEEKMEDELPPFERVFDALPDKPKDLRAHPKNRNAMGLAAIMLQDAMSIPVLLEMGEFDYGEGSEPNLESMNKAAKLFKENMEKGLKASSKMSDEEWEEPAKFLMDGKMLYETTKGDAVWGVLFDAIHHRGQLSTHIRPQGGKVPSIYGPSADDMGGM